MMRNPDAARKTDVFFARLRWVLLASAAALVLPQTAHPAVIFGFAALATANFAALRCALPRAFYVQRGRHAMAAMRVAEAVAAALLALHPALRADHVWVLAVPDILAEPLVSRQARRAFAVALAPVLALALCRPAGASLMSTLIEPVSVFCLAAACGLVLSAFQAQEDLLRSHGRRLDAVLDCASSLAAGGDLHTTVLHALKAAVLESNAAGGYVMLADEREASPLSTEAAFSPDGEFQFPRILPFGAGISGSAARTGRPVVVADGADERLLGERLDPRVLSVVSVPLVARSHWHRGVTQLDSALGAMTLIGRPGHPPAAPADMRLLKSLAALIASSVAGTRMDQRQQTTFLNTLETLANSLEARDPYTRGHSQRASDVAACSARNLA